MQQLINILAALIAATTVTVHGLRLLTAVAKLVTGLTASKKDDDEVAKIDVALTKVESFITQLARLTPHVTIGPKPDTVDN